jgi:hypothetical protein
MTNGGGSAGANIFRHWDFVIRHSFVIGISSFVIPYNRMFAEK